jgi:hypothetical protein
MPTEVVRLKIKTPWETEVLVIDLKFDKHSNVLQVNNLSAFPNVPYIPAIRTCILGFLSVSDSKQTNLEIGYRENKLPPSQPHILFGFIPSKLNTATIFYISIKVLISFA